MTAPLDWPLFLARVEVRFPMPIRIRYAPPAHEGEPGSIWWEHRAADRDAGEPRWIISVKHQAPPFSVHEEWQAIGWLRTWTQESVLHELDESIHLDGRRMFDPHGGCENFVRTGAQVGLPGLEP